MKKLILFVFIASLFTACASNQEVISEKNLKETLYYLASDELKGRMTGSEGIRQAATYIANRYREMGLQPMGDSGGYFRYYDFIAGAEPDAASFLSVNGKNLVYGSDFTFKGFTGTADIKDAELVFAGFGVRSDSLKYDDYSGIDVTGKVVVVLRYNPDGDNPHSVYNPISSFRAKTKLAKEKGAAAVLFVNSKEDDDVLQNLEYDRAGTQALPAIQVKRSVVDQWFKMSGLETLSALETGIQTLKRPDSKVISGVKISLHSGLHLIKKPAYNVVGYFPGSDSLLKKEFVVLGAHYDHWGMGGSGSLYRGNEPQIHNGADDNASGSAGIVELARTVINQKNPPKRSLIVAAFSGEELGLLGSSALVSQFPVPTSQVVTMFNFDMIGRLDSVNQLVIYGMGTSSQFKTLADSLNKNYQFKLSFKDEGYGPSDHSSFYSKDIPVMFFHTGLHSDYHRPSDDADKINYAGTKKVLDYASAIVETIVNQPVKPDFIKVKSQSAGRSMAFNVYIGTIPDYAYNDKGLKITGVNPGSPADKAGLKGGDVILQIGASKIDNIYDYTDALSSLKAGKEEVLVYKRDGKEIKGTITPGKRN